MNRLKNYYNILNLKENSTEEEIYNAYNLQISQFNNLPFHTQKMINEIKILKEAIYVLGNTEKRNKYNKKWKSLKDFEELDTTIDNTKICDRLFSIKFNN